MADRLVVSSGTNATFEIAGAAAQTRLDVFDVRGRLISTLVNEQLPAGEYDYTWSGDDSRGVRMPAGIYFYRLQVDGFESSSKLILLR
jgi:flagellar hook assembly protein FlgD